MRSGFALAVLVLLFAGCSSKPAPSSSVPATSTMEPMAMQQVHNVTIQGTAFVNGSFTIHVGDVVHWVHNDGQTGHSVTSDAGDPESFDSSPNCAANVPVGQVCMVQGSTFDHAFAKAGTYGYHCKVHSSMTGTITVIP
ncbi:MAG: cupredoxin domain-containing protein [Thermoplasmatota archaeon]